MNGTRARMWRSLEQAADDPAFLARAADEFPGLAAAIGEKQDRRQILRLMAAAFAMAGLGGCDPGPPAGGLTPAVRYPANIVPGVPNRYATARVLDGYATGTVITHNMGRPTKVDGNPNHPSSLGGSDAFMQAQVLDFYDPDRAAQINEKGEPSERQSLQWALAARRDAWSKSRGAGLRVLTGTVTSPTLSAQLDALLRRYPQAQWHHWQPVARDAVLSGAMQAYGQPVEMLARPEAADVLLAIDSDLISSAPGHLAYARGFASRRNPTRTQAMSRVYAVEPTPTLIGAVADHRFMAGPAELHRIMAALAADIVSGTAPGDAPPWLALVAADLKGARSRALVHVGPDQPAALHALAHAINEKLGARGVTFDLIGPVAHAPADNAASLRTLIADMEAGRVTDLVMIDSNPVYAAPGSWGFEQALRRVNFSLALNGRADETARRATWFVPMAHEWEAWSDALAHDGTAAILQPQALPFYGGVSPHEMLDWLVRPDPRTAEQAVRDTWFQRLGADGWTQALAQGVIANTAAAKSNAALHPQASQALPEPHPHALNLLLRPDPSLWDGRFANNPWLQELPRPLTKVVWDNPLLIAPVLAERMRLENGDRVRLSLGAASVTAPVWIMPGQSPDSVTAWIGSGRSEAGTIGDASGVDFNPLAGLDAPVELQREGGRERIASTVHHALLLETPPEILRHGTLDEFHADPRFAANEKPEPHLYRTIPPGPAAWAMSVDLNACIGCNACVVACQSENNIPTVGKDQVLREREMHWLRIDRYFEGDAGNPESFFEPVLCMHCEQAPCEIVCPVGATVHDSEGLNLMVYNRCIGTRFCSNNCPYKVRRFNYFGYGYEQHRPPQSWNPDVTVRGRGVMEKCTYCVQRIAESRIEADRDGHPEREIRTACQDACPTRAFTFGNLADANSAVSKRKQSPLDFAMLEKQNTHPRTTYEALVRNPNPAIKGASA